MRATALSCACLLLLIAGLSATADPITLPAVNLGDTSFLDGKAGPTTLVQLYATRIQFERITDGNGDTVPGDNEIGGIRSNGPARLHLDI